MLKEFLEALWSKAQQAARPTILDTGREPHHRYLLAKADGDIEFCEAEPSPRQHKAGDLSAIIDWAKKGEERDEKPVVWFSREGVSLFLDDSTRRDVVKLPLYFHPQLKTLNSCEAKPEWKDQRSFVAFLRVALSGCHAEEEGLVEAVRRVRFRKNEEGESVIHHNKASIGRSLECELTGSSTIPERVALKVPIFTGALSFIAHSIACAIEIDAAQEKFQLVPLPGEIENAVCLAEADIGRELVENLQDKVPVYYGTP